MIFYLTADKVWLWTVLEKQSVVHFYIHAYTYIDIYIYTQVYNNSVKEAVIVNFFMYCPIKYV